jgi:hypothetical protein
MYGRTTLFRSRLVTPGGQEPFLIGELDGVIGHRPGVERVLGLGLPALHAGAGRAAVRRDLPGPDERVVAGQRASLFDHGGCLLVAWPSPGVTDMDGRVATWRPGSLPCSQWTSGKPL